MNSSFYNGVSGIKTMQNALDLWGDNIANVNTVGYKTYVPEFSTLFSQVMTGGSSTTVTSEPGYGTRIGATALDVSEGSLITTDSNYDLAIEGDGWFGVKTLSGDTYFTRNGGFTRDASGYLVDQSGNFLLGTSANNISNGVVTPKQSVDIASTTGQTPLQLPTLLTYPATPTTKITVKSNLSPEAEAAHLVGQIIKADGSKQTVDLQFAKSATQPTTGSSWDITARLGDVTNPDETVTGTLTFDGIGALTSSSNLTIGGVTVDFGSLYSGLTSIVGVSADSSLIHDGYDKGALIGYAIDNEGTITASFDNSRSSVIGKIPLFHFQNDQGLGRAGDTLYSATVNSGKPIFFADSSGQFIQGGDIVANRLEASNVSLAKALTELIVIQKSYASNANAITTSDQLLQKAINMKK